MNYHWNWRIFWEQAPEGGTYFGSLLLGLELTLATALSAWVMALAIGAVVGTVRTMPKRWLARIGDGYVELFRNIPLLVQVFLWYFVMPELVPAAVGDWLKSQRDAPFITTVIALGFYTSARVAIQVSAGINTLPRGQTLAGQALGLTLPQTYRYVLLPMAFRIIIPPLTSDFLSIIKNSAVGLTIGLMELTGSARAMQEFSLQVFEAFTAATVLYVAVNIVIVNFMRLIEAKVAVPGYIIGGEGMD